MSAFLQEQQKSSLPEWFANFEELYTKRLWHQLSVKLLEFVQLEQAKQLNLVEIYENFISDFETKINQLTLVEIIVFIVKQIKKQEEAITFIQKIQDKVKTNQDAKILCQILVGNIKLANNDLKGELHHCRVLYWISVFLSFWFQRSNKLFLLSTQAPKRCSVRSSRSSTQRPVSRRCMAATLNYRPSTTK